MSFRFTIQYQMGLESGTKEIIAETQEQAMDILWEELSKTANSNIGYSYRTASVVNVQF